MNYLSDLAEDIGDIRKLTRERHRQTTRHTIAKLPVWPELIRGAPNSFLRSALFPAIQGKSRRYSHREVLGAPQGTIVRFTGKQLDQSDLDVWEQAVHQARTLALGDVCYFKASTFLKTMGRDNGKAQYDWLEEAIGRLAGCYVEIHTGPTVFKGNLLSHCVREEKTGTYMLALDPNLISLYHKNDWTGIEWGERQKLRGKPLALWLHGFYSSQEEVCSMKVETLRELSGSTNKDEYDFKRKLKTAFSDIKLSAGINAAIQGNLVTMKPRPKYPKIIHLRAA